MKTLSVFLLCILFLCSAFSQEQNKISQAFETGNVASLSHYFDEDVDLTVLSSEGILKYTERLKHFCAFSFLELPDTKRSKKISFEEQKRKEGEMLLQKTPKNAHVILLDEKGKEFTSRQFAQQIENYQNTLSKDIFFVIGGPYGFSKEMYARAQAKISFSKMTFSHQMIRLFFVEQIYRAFSILKNLPYHHD